MPSFQIFVIDGERPHLGAAVRQDRIRPFIHSVYASRVVTSASASACAVNVASGWQ
jgi:hypothetical protein